MNEKVKILMLLLTTVMIFSGLTKFNYQLSNNSDSLDLPTIMRLIYADMQIINEGIYTENFKLIQQGAAAINEHPPLSDDTRAMIKKALGERMQAFAQYDKLVHDTADSLRLAATNSNMESVLEKYQIIQQGCVSCHASFRKEITQARISVN